ncbi:FAD-dependent oxidoreductase [Photobacterium phosphoreum]|uniref:oxidoreductase n=1 Tax=Photobacterium phosphoreum TaxID=659 RepID=UPI000D169C45|nr:FAD-dependent oxidoreductase [Photobacterium phosphoreum]PSU83154.1 2-enoate reductase [Photobacterium phosphoreum]
MNRSELFTPMKIGSVTIKNRIVMEPMGLMGLAGREGEFNQRAADYFVERAKGGVGLIITGFTKVENEIERMKMPTFTCVTHNPTAFENSCYEMIERVHSYGAKIFLQVSAGLGRVAKPTLLETQPVAPTAVPNYWDPEVMCRALTTEEVERIISRFEEAAAIAKKVGFDGIELHAVHEGYLADQFTMSVFNKDRTDRFNGDLEQRATFPIEILKAIRRGAGENYPVTVRYSIRSFIKELGKGGINVAAKESGRDTEEGLELAKILEKAGYDGFNADTGSYDAWYWAHPPLYAKDGLYLPFVKKLKDVVNVPIIMGGKMGDPQLAQDSIKNGSIDFVGLARPLLTDPEWPNKVMKNREEQIRPCIGCHDGCLQRIFNHKPISCSVNPACGREKIYSIEKALEPKRVIVIGGGIAGLESARVAKLAGHEVKMFEKSDQIGGHIYEAAAPDFKKADEKLLDWYRVELERLAVPMYLNTIIDKDSKELDDAQAVIIATGSVPVRLRNIEGIDEPQICSADDILLAKKPVGDNVVIIGGGLVGCEVALWLKNQGKQVTVVEYQSKVMDGGADTNWANKSMLLDLMEEAQVDIMTSSKFVGYKNGHAHIETATGVKEIVADNVCIAVGYSSVNDLHDEILSRGKDTYLIGDARKVSNIMNAVWDAYEVARNI